MAKASLGANTCPDDAQLHSEEAPMTATSTCTEVTVFSPDASHGANTSPDDVQLHSEEAPMTATSTCTEVTVFSPDASLGANTSPDDAQLHSEEAPMTATSTCTEVTVFSPDASHGANTSPDDVQLHSEEAPMTATSTCTEVTVFSPDASHGANTSPDDVQLHSEEAPMTATSTCTEVTVFSPDEETHRTPEVTLPPDLDECLPDAIAQFLQVHTSHGFNTSPGVDLHKEEAPMTAASTYVEGRAVLSPDGELALLEPSAEKKRESSVLSVPDAAIHGEACFGQPSDLSSSDDDDDDVLFIREELQDILSTNARVKVEPQDKTCHSIASTGTTGQAMRPESSETEINGVVGSVGQPSDFSSSSDDDDDVLFIREELQDILSTNARVKVEPQDKTCHSIGSTGTTGQAVRPESAASDETEINGVVVSVGQPSDFSSSSDGDDDVLFIREELQDILSTNAQVKVEPQDKTCHSIGSAGRTGKAIRPESAVSDETEINCVEGSVGQRSDFSSSSDDDDDVLFIREELQDILSTNAQVKVEPQDKTCHSIGSTGTTGREMRPESSETEISVVGSVGQPSDFSSSSDDDDDVLFIREELQDILSTNARVKVEPQDKTCHSIGSTGTSGQAIRPESAASDDSEIYSVAGSTDQPKISCKPKRRSSVIKRKKTSASAPVVSEGDGDYVANPRKKQSYARRRKSGGVTRKKKKNKGKFVPSDFDGSDESTNDPDYVPDSMTESSSDNNEESYISDLSISFKNLVKSNSNATTKVISASSEDECGPPDLNEDEIIRDVKNLVKSNSNATTKVISASSEDECGPPDLNEDEIIRDVIAPGIYVRKVIKSYEPLRKKEKITDRVSNSFHSCLFCGKLFLHVITHMLSKHRGKDEVEKIKGMLPSDEQEKDARKEKLDAKMPFTNMLRSRGDHEHNLKVVKEKRGELLLFRRPSAPFSHEDYTPCPKCLEWLLKKSLPKHQKTCSAHKVSSNSGPRQRKRELLSQSEILLGKITTCASDILKDEVFSIMTNDSVGSVAKKDLLIVILGEYWIRRCIHNVVKRKYYASQHMRLAARLLHCLRGLDKDQIKGNSCPVENRTMWYYLRPAYFDNLTKAAIEICLPDMDDAEQLKSPSNAIKIKYDLIRMAETKSVISTQELDKDRSQTRWTTSKLEADELLHNIDKKWAELVTRNAQRLMAERKLNCVQLLPKPEEVKKLSKFLVENLMAADLSKDCVTWNQYRDIVQLVQSRLLTYNKRRSGELEAILLSSYKKCKKGLPDIDVGMMGELTETEQHLLETQDLIETKGKRGRPVPVLIPNDCVKALEYIADCKVRQAAGIDGKNKFLFANMSNSIVRAYDSLRRVCDNAGLDAPERITSVAMRKYMATLTQVLNLTPNQLDHVCRHLGHNKTVHLEHYRQMSPFLERIEIGKILMMQDLNMQANYFGKTLDQVDFSDILTHQGKGNASQPCTGRSRNDQDDVTVVERVKDKNRPRKKAEEKQANSFQPRAGTSRDCQDDLSLDERVMDENRQRKKAKKNARCDDEEVSEDDFWGEVPKKKAKVAKQRGKQKQGISVRQKWSEIEIEEISKYLSDFLEGEITPGKNECLRAMQLSKKNGGELHRRPYTKIVKKVSNMIMNRKKRRE